MHCVLLKNALVRLADFLAYLMTASNESASNELTCCLVWPFPYLVDSNGYKHWYVSALWGECLTTYAHYYLIRPFIPLCAHLSFYRPHAGSSASNSTAHHGNCQTTEKKSITENGKQAVHFGVENGYSLEASKKTPNEPSRDRLANNQHHVVYPVPREEIPRGTTFAAG